MEDQYEFDRVVPVSTGVPEDPVHHDPERHPYWGEHEPVEREESWLLWFRSRQAR